MDGDEDYAPLELELAARALQNWENETAAKEAEPYLEADDDETRLEAHRISGLAHFRLKNYGQSLVHHRTVTEMQDSLSAWFNVVTSATLAGEVKEGERAMKRAVRAPFRADNPDTNEPALRFQYATALSSMNEHRRAMAQIDQVVQYYGITDMTYLMMRGMPTFESTLEIAMSAFRGLGDSFDGDGWLARLSENVDEEGKEYLTECRAALKTEGKPG